MTRHGLCTGELFAHYCVTVYISETARNWGDFQQQEKDLSSEPELHAVESCGFVFRHAVPYTQCGCKCVGKRGGDLGSIQKGPE